MNESCAVCAHAERAEIEKGLLAIQSSTSALAETYGIQRAQLIFHNGGHLKKHNSIEETDRTIAQLKNKIAAAGTDSRYAMVYLRLADQLKKQLEFRAKLTGELKTGAQNGVTSLCKDLGLEGEDELRRIVLEQQQAAQATLDEKVMVCEQFLGEVYRIHPEIASRSNFLRVHSDSGAEVAG